MESLTFQQKYRRAFRKNLVFAGLSSFALSVTALFVAAVTAMVLGWVSHDPRLEKLDLSFTSLMAALVFGFLIYVLRCYTNVYLARRARAMVAASLQVDLIKPLYLQTPPQSGAKTFYVLRLIEDIAASLDRGVAQRLWDALFATAYGGLLYLIYPPMALIYWATLPIYLSLGLAMVVLARRQPAALENLAYSHFFVGATSAQETPSTTLSSNDVLSRLWAHLLHQEFQLRNKATILDISGRVLALVATLILFYLNARLILHSYQSPLLGASFDVAHAVGTTLMTGFGLLSLSGLPSALHTAEKTRMALRHLERTLNTPLVAEPVVVTSPTLAAAMGRAPRIVPTLESSLDAPHEAIEDAASPLSKKEIAHG